MKTSIVSILPVDFHPSIRSVALSVIAVVPLLIILAQRFLQKRVCRPLHAGLKYQAFVAKPGVEATLVVDCLHPSCPTLTHHKGSRTPPEVKGDTSGSIVLNAIKASHPILQGQHFVTCDHYDIDGLVAVWAAMHPALALSRYDELLRAASIIGDLRELDLRSPSADEALHLCCWSNSVERNLFYRPFEGSERDGCDHKYKHFLPRMAGVLEGLAEGNAATVCAEGMDEYQQVIEDYNTMQEDTCVRDQLPEIGLVILAPPRPVHYYALFSRTIGYDTVLTIFPGNRYELECKYSGYIDITSRPVFPRLDLQPLTEILNSRESAMGVQWTSSRFTDSGPILRLDSTTDKLTKAQRYGNPCERPMFTSSIPPADFTRLVVSFFSHGLSAVKAKRFWKWEEVKRVNREIQWDLLELH
jgi:hypothetical protein